MTTNRHGVVAFEFERQSLCIGCSLTHAGCGTLDLLMTDVADKLRVAVVKHPSNLDHSYLAMDNSKAHAIPYMCLSWKVFLKHHINRDTVCGAIQDIPC